MKEAILRATTLVSGLIAMHYAGYKECDLHLKNIIIENKPELGYPCRIIDFENFFEFTENPDESSEENVNDYVEHLEDEEEAKVLDMHDLARALPYILFGKYNDYRPRKIRKRSSDECKKLFSERNPYPCYRHFSFINKLMERNLHRSYPKPILRRLAILIANLNSPYPEDRPTAVDVFEELQDMALADWENSHYSIQTSQNDQN